MLEDRPGVEVVGISTFYAMEIRVMPIEYLVPEVSHHPGASLCEPPFGLPGRQKAPTGCPKRLHNDFEKSFGSEAT